MLKQSIGMTENNAKQIAEMYLSRYNPTYWDGSGKVPSEVIFEICRVAVDSMYNGCTLDIQLCKIDACPCYAASIHLFEGGFWTGHGIGCFDKTALCYDIGSVYGKPNPYKPLPVSNYNHTVRFLLGFLYFYDVDLTLGYQSRYAWNEARKVAYLADIFAGKDAGEIVFQEIPSSDPQPKYQLIKGEQEAITLREFYENRLLYKKACYNDIRADDIFWFRHTMLRMIVYNAKHEPSTEHEDIAIISRILFGRY